MKIAVWLIVALLAVNAGLNAYATLRKEPAGQVNELAEVQRRNYLTLKNEPLTDLEKIELVLLNERVAEREIARLSTAR